MLKLEVITKNEIIDITELVEQVTWSGDTTQAARSIDFSVVNSIYDKELPKVNIELGNLIKIYENKKELFRGYVFTRDKKSTSNTISYKCYDGAIYTLKNEGVYNFKNKSPEEITRKVCSDFGIPIGKLAYTGVKINRKFFGTNIYEIIMTAYTLASIKNKRKYILKCIEGKLVIEERGNTTIGILFENGSNILESNFTDSIEDMINKVIVIDKEGKTIAEEKDITNINQYGQFQKILKEEEGKSAKDNAKAALKSVSQKASISGIGDTSCITGNGVKVKDSYTGITGLFYIDSDTHTWSNGIYQVSLTLNFQNIMNEVDGGDKDE